MRSVISPSTSATTLPDPRFTAGRGYLAACTLGIPAEPTIAALEHDLVEAYRVRQIGACDGVEERYFAIGTNRRLVHPLVQRLMPAGA